MYELIIIGGGPAACGAAVYAARKQLRSALITPAFGGQSDVSPEIYNWVGTNAIPGAQLAKNLENHVRQYEGEYMTIMTGQSVTHVRPISEGFEVTTDKDTYKATTVLIASGSHRRKLDIPGADQYENKGVVYCASCDGPLFAGQDVVVIGGGNAGFETAAQLLAYCKSVTLLDRGERFKADELTVESVLKTPNMTAINNAAPAEIVGEKFVTGLQYKNTLTGEEILLPTTGIFVEIGQLPNTDFVRDTEGLTLNPYNHVVVDPRTQRTTLTGIWAAGDVTDGLYHQNNIAVGDAVKALEDIYLYIKTGK